jgi:hypothetical protein
MANTSYYNEYFWRIAKDMSNIFFVKLTYILDNWVRLTKQTVRSVKRLLWARGFGVRSPVGALSARPNMEETLASRY